MKKKTAKKPTRSRRTRPRRKPQPLPVHALPRRFYVGSRDISAAIGKGLHHDHLTTLEEATEEAMRDVEQGRSECATVVQVIRVIRRRQVPLLVESVIQDDVEPEDA